MNTITAIVGQRIRSCRLKNGLTQEELAERAELHPTYIGQAERGEKNLALVSLERILSALYLIFSEFFEHMELGKNQPNFAAQCYDIVNKMSQADQEHIYRILRELEQLTE